MKGINESFVFNAIRKFNRAKRQTLKDAVLVSVGIHAGLMEREAASRDLMPEERQRVIRFLRQFLKDQGVKVEIKEPVQ